MQYSSLIYACLPKVYDLIQENTGSIVVVVCPLIALMKDQVTSFRNLGLSAAYVGEKTVKRELFVTGQIQMVLISPELLGKGTIWRDMLKAEVYHKHLVALVIDEAHLIKNW